jgi:hypothetical protein
MEPLVINYSIARHLFGLSTSRVLAFVALTLLAALFEGFGMAMLLPVLEFVEKDQDAAQLAGASDNWRKLIDIYAALGIQVNLFTLLSAQGHPHLNP